MKKISALRKLMAIAIALALMLSCLTVGFAETGDSSEAVATGTPWDGKTLTQPTSGSGNTEDDPMLISTPDELAWVINSGGNSKYYKLTADIYINDISAENWTASAKSWFATGANWMSYHNINGAGNIKFSGHIDGAGHTVYGLYTDGKGGAYSNGLIPVMSSGSIKRLCVSGANINNARFTAGIIGAVHTGQIEINSCVVKDSTLNCGTTTSAYSNEWSAGGLVGHAGSAAVLNIRFCAALNNTLDGKYSGSILGNIHDGKATASVYNSYSVGAVTAFCGKTDASYNIFDFCGKTADITSADLIADNDFLKCSSGFVSVENDYPLPKELVGKRAEVWGGSFYEIPTDTDESGAILINSAEELYYVVGTGGGSGKTYKLTADIWLNDTTDKNWKTSSPNVWFVGSGGWNAGYTGINGTGKQFSGTLDGDGHTVYGIYSVERSTDKSMTALLPSTKGAVVKNLMIKDSELQEAYAGAVSGVANTGLTVENCYIDSTVSVNGTAAGGGIVGYAPAKSEITIKGCASAATVAGTPTGSLIGNIYQGTLNVENSYSVTTKPIGQISGSTATITEVYTNDSNTYKSANSPTVTGSVTVMTDAKMTGHTARAFMPKLGSSFVTVENGYPVQQIFADEGTHYAFGYNGGDGSEASPYLLKTAEDLYHAIGGHGGYSFKLLNDIDLSEFTAQNVWFVDNKWNVGYGFTTDLLGYFTGTLDGDGYAVSGLNYSDNTAANLGGLIPATKGSVEVKKLGLENSNIKTGTDGYSGGIIGFANSSTVTVDQCYVASTVDIASGKKFNGGIVGYNYGTGSLTVTNSYTQGKTITDYIASNTTVNISSSYSLDSLPYRTDKVGGTLTLNNVYSNKSDTRDGLKCLDSLMGKDALTKMTALDGKLWYATESSSPMLRLRGNVIGDADENGVGPEFDDISALRVILISNPEYSNGDYNRDGDVDICDLVKLSIEFSSINLEKITALYGDYYGIEMSIVSDQVDALGEDAVNYIFVTDIHYKDGNSEQDKVLLKQMEAITKMANSDDSIDFVVIGGDTTTGMYNTKQDCIDNTNEVLAPLKECKKPVFVLMGNHDDNSYHVYSNGGFKQDIILSDMDWTTKVLAVNSPENIVHDKYYANSKYYYYDLPEKKTRVVCLDAIDCRTPFDPETGAITELLPADFANNSFHESKKAGNAELYPARQFKTGTSYLDYSSEQLKWLTEQVLIEKDYNYIFLSHMGIDSDTNSGGNSTHEGGRDKLRAIIEAYNNKGSYEDTDFADHNGKILSYQFGHIHVELTTYSEDIDLWQICSASANVDQTGNQTLDDIQGSSINNKKLDWNPIYRALGTDSEAYFDIMSVTEDAVYKFNIGTGSSETMSYPN